MNLDPTITLGAVTNLVALTGLGVTLVTMARKTRRENESDTKKAGEEIKAAVHSRLDETRELLKKLELTQGERISKIEGVVGGFVPRPEIEGKFDHERRNRQQLGDVIGRQLETCSNDIRSLMVKVGTMEQRQDTHDATMTEIKALLREGFREQATKIERLTESLGTRP